MGQYADLIANLSTKKQHTSLRLFAFHVAIWSLLDIVKWMALTMTLFRVADVGD